MLRVVEHLHNASGRGEVVRETSDESGLAAAAQIAFLPDTEKSDYGVGLPPLVENLGEEVEIGDQCRLQDDWGAR